MTRALAFSIVFSCCVIAVSDSRVNAQNPFDRVYNLAADEQRVVVDAINEGRSVQKILSAKGRTAEAEELASILSDLERRTYSHAYRPLADDAYAYVYSMVGIQTIHLTPKFFDLAKLEKRALPDFPLAEIQRKARLEQLSFLMHEWKHTQYQSILDFGRPEEEAYRLQYRWLKIFGITDADKTETLPVVMSQLAADHVTLPTVTPAGDMPASAGRIEPPTVLLPTNPQSNGAAAKCEAGYQDQVRQINANTQWNYSGLASWTDGCPAADGAFTACYEKTCKLYRDAGISNDCTDSCRATYRTACTAENLAGAAARRDQCAAQGR